jgi:DNA polymerase I
VKTLTIIDTFGFFFRSYYALPPLRNSKGFPTGLLTGFINLIDALRRDHATDYLIFALDSKGKTFRSDLFADYKANRESPPEDLLRQLPVAIEWIERMGFANLSAEGYEADDIITTVTRIAKDQGMRVRIVSHDKDLYQLIDDGKVVMIDTVKKCEVDEAACIEKFGVRPRDFVNFQAIVGDSSDNIPGVKGIGQKGAAKLINQFKTLEHIYEHIEEAGTPRIQKLLLDSKEQAFLSRELVALRQDVFDTFDLGCCRFDDKNYLAPLAEDFEHYEMRQALKKAHANGAITSERKMNTHAVPNDSKPHLRFDAVTLETSEKLQAVVATLSPDTVIAFDTETTDLDTKVADLVGFSFCIDIQRAYYVPVAHSYLGVSEQVPLEDALAAIRQILRAKVVGQNLKFDLSLLYNRYDFDEVTPHADTMILAWLIDPGQRVGLDAMAERYFGHTMRAFKETVKRGENFSSVAIEEATLYAAEDAWMTLMLYGALMRQMELGSLGHLVEEAREIEYPYINVLARMQSHGIRVDQECLKSLRGYLEEILQDLTQQIYALTQSEFNIRSTQQLGEVLFGQLGLQGAKRTKTGYSTNEKVLLSLRNKHPVIEKILLYREHQKMLSTYAEPLLRLAAKDSKSRIYTSFLQTGTATGRLSSKEPNLQNIPVRTPLGRRIREAFVAKEGYRLVSIDYSQIELRLLAHFSEDQALMEAFAAGEDIHRATAVKLFGEHEATQKRSLAKAVNFGLLYGMGSRKLADDLQITTTEAKSIIESYFAALPTVKRFLEQIQEEVKVQGYVETLLGRRRIFDYDNANGMQKAAYQRESVNTVFQGSAADLIKLSMIQIDRLILDEQLDAQMLLQIHDELVFEITQNEAESLAERFGKIMETVYPLKVPLECAVSIGQSWGELK